MNPPAANSSASPLVSPTSSQSLTKTVNGSHRFTIQGYSLAKGMGVGKHIASENFTVGGYQWAIYFYPDGKNPEDNSAYVSVFIALASEGTDVRALFELKLLDQSGRGKHKVHSHFDRSLEGGPYTLKYRGSMWGYKRFFRRAMLETSEFLKDDCLKINCTVGVVVSEIDCPRLHSIQVPESDIGAHFGFLLENEEGSDATFNVSGEKFRAHKLVLAARSPVFEAEFLNAMEEDNDEVVISDMEPKVFQVRFGFLALNIGCTARIMDYPPSFWLRIPFILVSCVFMEQALLHFIYKDTLDEDEELSIPSAFCSPSEMPVAKLLAAADRYNLPRLKLICESILCKGISVDSVARILALAEQHHAMDLKSICLKFAAENLVAVMRSDGFEYLKENCPSLQSELLKTVAGCEEQVSGGGNRSVFAQFSDGNETNNRSIRQQDWDNLAVRSQSLWMPLSDGGDASGPSPGPES
ncbi:BTB/POZ and MATH domain-containing protein 4 isoform X1 [Syzygium oleosum]|uniref:BTB/POZ and MATH domain-containing protein 4 isoform X1 n=1 Tax=Syzygium oleosum TaxID=219896 RepID=UPI0011D280F1|nr:BTB/POZ and MATH domain-containing protein 4 isoform X1 [Syzygium oleosum]